MSKNKKKGKTRATNKKHNSLMLKEGVIISLLIIGSLLTHLSCSNEKIQGDLSKQFALLPASYTGINFENYVQETASRGLTFFEYFYTGSGVAIGDVNNRDVMNLALIHVGPNKRPGFLVVNNNDEVELVVYRQ